jgi:amino acid permease
MHYNAPRFYRELKNRTLKQYSTICWIAFSISGLIYIGIACFGYLTFGSNSSSFILNNYSPNDPLAIICRVAVGISTLTAYPIVFMGIRDGVLDIWNIPIQQQTSHQLNTITLLLLLIVTIISMI